MPWIFNQAEQKAATGLPQVSWIAYVYSTQLAPALAQAVARQMAGGGGWTWLLDDVGKPLGSFQWGTGAASGAAPTLLGAWDMTWDVHTKGHVPRTPAGWELTWDVHTKGALPPGEHDRVGDATQVLWIYVPTLPVEGDQRFPGAALWRAAPDTSQLGWAAVMAQAIAKALFPPLPQGQPLIVHGQNLGTPIPLGTQAQQPTQYVWLLDLNGKAVQGYAYGSGTPWQQTPIQLAGDELGAAPKAYYRLHFSNDSTGEEYWLSWKYQTLAQGKAERDKQRKKKRAYWWIDLERYDPGEGYTTVEGELDGPRELELGAEAKIWAVHDVWETPESGIWRLVSRSQPVFQTEREARSWDGTWYSQSFGKGLGFQSPYTWIWKGGGWQRAA